jgi:hypothetical protein
MPFGPEPFGNELKAELLTAEGRISEYIHSALHIPHFTLPQYRL